MYGATEKSIVFFQLPIHMCENKLESVKIPFCLK